jgi:ABC-type multidrug transport system ATPase subunit
MTLEFDGIEFGYDERRLLTSVHVKCNVGQVVGLLGRNGTGKSTLMKIAFGAVHSEVASVRINGKPLRYPAYASRMVSYLPQDRFLPGNLSLKNILAYYQVEADKMLTLFPELADDFSLLPAQISGGRLRLFEVLLILLRPVPFCMLDEPFTGLSPLFIERLQEFIALTKQTKGVIISDHLHRKVMSIADAVYLLSNGTTFLVKDSDDLVRRGYLHEGPGVEHTEEPFLAKSNDSSRRVR